MLPTSKTVSKPRRQAPASRGRSVLRSEGTEQAEEALRPIGPERLRELREAIRNGTYPSEADVLGGLQRLLDVD